MAAELPAVILLAGGAGARAGGPKGLLEVEGRPWLEHQLEALRSAHLTRVVIVLGHARELYEARLPWLGLAAGRSALGGWCEQGGLQLAVVQSSAPELGPFTSLVAGAQWLLGLGATSAFVLPVDVPTPSTEVFVALARALDGRGVHGSAAAVLAAIPTFEGRGGHPVLLAASVLSHLCGLEPRDPAARLDLQLRALPAESLARVEVDDARVLANRNERAQWR